MKEITVYVSHYIVALKVVYIESDLNETEVIHSSNNKYLNERPDLEKHTLKFLPHEYIDYISYTSSSQNNFIRSLRIETTDGQQLIIEGQIELNNMNVESGQDSNYSSLVGGTRTDQKDHAKSYVVNQTEMEKLNGGNKESLNIKSEEPVAIKTHQYNTKSAHQQSILKVKENSKSLHFVKLNQRVIGLKTRFCGYLKGIDLYTEPCTYHRI
mmetsp:Transcript_2517/g.2970  ORF Transcript_2517/g.2970 Transcript_2517/m.2970 type:complete len:212 (-) Transcript_2517:10-645(-)